MEPKMRDKTNELLFSQELDIITRELDRAIWLTDAQSLIEAWIAKTPRAQELGLTTQLSAANQITVMSMQRLDFGSMVAVIRYSTSPDGVNWQLGTNYRQTDLANIAASPLLSEQQYISHLVSVLRLLVDLPLRATTPTDKIKAGTVPSR
jgi:hypothetical protein